MIKEMVQKQRLYDDVFFLTSLQPARSYFHPASLQKAAAYITEEFKKLSGRVSFQNLHDGFQNIIISFGPEEGERIIVGAHYDVCFDTPGADDNASAVAGLLELARLLHEQQPELPYRVDLVAYNFEEPPFFGSDRMGSAVHARSLAREGIKVKIMICLEMIGYYSDEPGSQKFPLPQLKTLYPSVGNFIVVVGKMGQEEAVEVVKRTMQEYADIDVQSINAPTSITGIDFSDHRNYWAQGYQAVMINDTSFLRNPHYHQLSDTIETLDFSRMVEVVRGLYGTVVHLK
jgi:Zn-dependent M28 family amino/carboxypeptidase